MSKPLDMAAIIKLCASMQAVHADNVELTKKHNGRQLQEAIESIINSLNKLPQFKNHRIRTGTSMDGLILEVYNRRNGIRKYAYWGRTSSGDYVIVNAERNRTDHYPRLLTPLWQLAAVIDDWCSEQEYYLDKVGYKPHQPEADNE